MVEFTVLEPPEPLKRDVECFRCTSYASGDRLSVKVCPSGKPQVVFQHGTRRPPIETIVTDSGRVVRPPRLFVHGQITEVALMHFQGPFTAIQVVLKPFALRSLFGLDAVRLADGSTTLEELCPDATAVRDLDHRLLRTGDAGERIALFSRFLEGLATASRHRDLLVEASVELIERTIKSVTVELVHKRSGLSERQFERRFIRAVGITPQRYLKIRRVNAAFRLMGSGEFERLSDVAHELNFYDQSHFIRDIKALSGTTPKSISQRVNDFHNDLVGSSYFPR